MKPYKYITLLTVAFILLAHNRVMAQEDSAGQKIVKLHYYNINNGVQYLLLESMLKKNKKFIPQKNKSYQLYLDSANAASLIARVQTDENGKAKAFLPPGLKTAWDEVPQHSFLVKEGEEEVVSDYIINKVKLALDTATTDGVRNITASVKKLENNEWLPAADVEMKIGIQRQGGILSAGDEETYTTDSTGSVTVELKKDSMPGDLKGNYILAANVQDNDNFGNLLVEKVVPWGTVSKYETNFFDQRTLWTTRFRTPYWLLVLVYGIALSVWISIIYLVYQIFKIKKMGDAVPTIS